MAYLVFSLIVISTMGVTLAFVRSNEILNNKEKRKFTIFIVLALYGLSGDLISFLCNNLMITEIISLHKFIKTSDFIIAPLIAWIFADFFEKNNKIKKFLQIIFLLMQL
jgi:hypothetical protein